MSLLTSLVSYWNLNETSGTRSDAHSTNDLTDNNFVTSNTGILGNAGQFTRADNEFLSHVDNADLSTGDIDFTFTAWVYLDDKTTHQRIITKLNTVGNNREYIVGYDLSANRLFFIVYHDGTGGSATQVDADNLGSPSTATWYFVVCWHDATANTLNIQVNNGTADSAAHSTGSFDGTATFNIGAQQSANQWWNGRIDEVGFWKRTLTAGEKTSLYNSGSGFAYPFTIASTVPRGLSPIGSGVVATTGGGYSGLHPIEKGFIA